MTALARRGVAPIEPAVDAPDDDPRYDHLATAIAALDAILAGQPASRVPPFDLSDRPLWDRDVLAAVAAVPWGTTVSYGEVARRVGAPRAARAVGGAVGRNPIGLLIPCHRVIAADGTIGGYGGDAWGEPRGAARTQARAPAARRRHGHRSVPIDSAPARRDPLLERR